jgi:radical SAM protein with 4Fe4S-binding SPASM domain
MPKYERVFIEITNVCNLACSFCCANKRQKQFISRELFEKVIDQSVPLVKEVVFHVLGEPLLHPQLEYFVDYARSAGLSVMITTNGTLLSPKFANVFAAKKIRQINISLHAIEQVDNKEEYLKNIFDFVFPLNKNDPDIYINLRLWNILSETNTEVVQGLNSCFNKKIVLPDKLDQFKDDKSYKLMDRIYLHLDTRFVWPDLSLPVIGEQGFCYGLNSHFGVLVDGTVVPCCLDGGGDIALGSIMNDDLNNILKLPRAKAIIDGFRQRKIKEELCKRCDYRTRFKK